MNCEGKITDLDGQEGSRGWGCRKSQGVWLLEGERERRTFRWLAVGGKFCHGGSTAVFKAAVCGVGT